MLLAIDVGNTNVVLGLYQGAELTHDFRVSTRRSATAALRGFSGSPWISTRSTSSTSNATLTKQV